MVKDCVIKTEESGSIHLVMLSNIHQNNQIFFVIRFFFKGKYNTAIILDLTGPKSNQFSVQLMGLKCGIKRFSGKLFQNREYLFL